MGGTAVHAARKGHFSDGNWSRIRAIYQSSAGLLLFLRSQHERGCGVVGGQEPD